MHTILLPIQTVDTLRQFTMRSSWTQPELQTRLGISPPTAYRAVEQLRELGVITDGAGLTPNGRGRPATAIALNSHGMCVFSLVIKNDDSHLYLIDALGQVLESISIPVMSTDRYETAVEQYAVEINRLLHKVSQSFAVTAGIGVFFGGRVNTNMGTIGTPSRFPDWHNRPLARDISQRTGLPCFIDNDTISLTKASFWFSPKLLGDSFALLYLDFGLGTGFCINQEIYTGRNHVASGLGHTNLFGWSDEQCRCGRTGCLETVISIPAVIKQAQKQHIPMGEFEPVISTATLIALEQQAQAGNALMGKIFEDVGHKTGILATSLCQIFDLPTVVFAGGLIDNSKIFLGALQREMRRQSSSLTLPISWWNMRDLLENNFPEALGGSAVALDGLYHLHVLTILE